ncbi:hypothetical protein U0070_003146 [Myodes glareolus]|uniref:Uncharacterized protein n=1 Tax=Myodes glareolus TaxID=447135 RepID=A0AAW0I2G2_MYOGA
MKTKLGPRTPLLLMKMSPQKSQ